MPWELKCPRLDIKNIQKSPIHSVHSIKWAKLRLSSELKMYAKNAWFQTKHNRITQQRKFKYTKWTQLCCFRWCPGGSSTEVFKLQGWLKDFGGALIFSVPGFFGWHDLRSNFGGYTRSGRYSKHDILIRNKISRQSQCLSHCRLSTLSQHPSQVNMAGIY